MSRKKNKKSKLKRQLKELQRQYVSMQQMYSFLSRCYEEATAGWKRALEERWQPLVFDVRLAKRWMWFAFWSNMFWVILVALILSEGGGE